MNYDFDHIIAPIQVEDFFSNYFEKKPCLIKRDSTNYYDNFLTIEDINQHLNEADIIYPNIRIVKDANQIHEAEFTYSAITHHEKFTQGIANKDKVFYYFYNGYTIVLNLLERHKASLLHLRHIFEKTFYAQAQANVYLTPENSQGFAAHWDSHDVFIIQISGSKEWKLYDSPRKLPTKNQTFKGIWERTEPSMSVILEAGDLLYIPRGFVHEANSTDRISLHITLGVMTYSYVDLLMDVLSQAENELLFRKMVCRRPDGKYIDNDQEFKDLVCEFIKKIDFDKIVEEKRNHFISTRLPDPTDRLKDYLKLKSLSSTTKLSKKKSVFYYLLPNGDKIEMRFNNKAVVFPSFVEETIQSILSMDTFNPNDIKGKLDAAGNLVVCKKLIEEGFLTITD